MIALKPVLLAWLEEAEAARRDPDGTNGLLPAGEKKRDWINHSHTMIVIIVKLRQGSGKDGQGMALQAK